MYDICILQNFFEIRTSSLPRQFLTEGLGSSGIQKKQQRYKSENPLNLKMKAEKERFKGISLKLTVYNANQDRILRGGVERCAPPLRSFCISPENFCTSPEKSCTSHWESFNDRSKWKFDIFWLLRVYT
jgi:hypothetical protein